MTSFGQQIRFCTSRDGTRIAYAISGSGPSVIRLAGLFTHLEFDYDSAIWQPWLSALAGNRMLIRYDARGSGLSDREGVEFSLERYLDDVEAVAKAAGLGRFALFGIGGPGPLGIAYAVRHPDRVTHLLLHAPFTRGRIARATSPAQIEEIEAVFKLISLGFGDDDPSRRQMLASQFLPDGSAEQLRELGDLLRVTSTPRDTVEFLRVFYNMDIRTMLPQVRCPTLVLHPRAGFRVPLEEGRLVAHAIPGARLVPLKTRNTYPPKDDPAWRQITAEIDSFLPSATAASAVDDLPLTELTPRERSIFGAVVEGLGNKEIARQFGISDKTVRNHLSSIFGKLGVSSRTQLIVRAHVPPR